MIDSFPLRGAIFCASFFEIDCKNFPRPIQEKSTHTMHDSEHFSLDHFLLLELECYSSEPSRSDAAVLDTFFFECCLYWGNFQVLPTEKKLRLWGEKCSHGKKVLPWIFFSLTSESRKAGRLFISSPRVWYWYWYLIGYTQSTTKCHELDSPNLCCSVLLRTAWPASCN